MKSPEAGCRGPRRGGQSGLDLLERSSEQTLTPPENLDLGSQTQGLLAGDSPRALLTWQAQRCMPNSTNMAFKALGAVTSAQPLQLWTSPVHIPEFPQTGWMCPAPPCPCPGWAFCLQAFLLYIFKSYTPFQGLAQISPSSIKLSYIPDSTSAS